MRYDFNRHSIIAMIVLISISFILLSGASLAATAAVPSFDIEKNTIRSNFVYFAPDNISRPDALNALLAADTGIKEMKSNNLTTAYVDDLLTKARQAYIGYGTSTLKADISQEKSVIKLDLLENMLAMTS